MFLLYRQIFKFVHFYLNLFNILYIIITYIKGLSDNSITKINKYYKKYYRVHFILY